MKKFLAVLLALCTVGVAMAQTSRYPSQRTSRDVILGQSQNRNIYNDRHSNNYLERERIAKVNNIREHYRYKIREVQRSRYMRPAEKRRQIRILERQRDLEIRRVNDYYKDRRNGRYDHGRRY